MEGSIGRLLDGLACRSGLSPYEGDQPGSSAAELGPEWHPEPRAFGEIDFGRHYADDGVAHSVEADHLADGVASRVEVVAPHPIRQDHHGCGAWVLIGGLEVAAEGRLYFEDTEEVRSGRAGCLTT